MTDVNLVLHLAFSAALQLGVGGVGGSGVGAGLGVGAGFGVGDAGCQSVGSQKPVCSASAQRIAPYFFLYSVLLHSCGTGTPVFEMPVSRAINCPATSLCAELFDRSCASDGSFLTSKTQYGTHVAFWLVHLLLSHFPPSQWSPCETLPPSWP